MRCTFLLTCFYFIFPLLALGDVIVNSTLRPWDEEDKNETLFTTPSVRSASVQQSFADNSGQIVPPMPPFAGGQQSQNANFPPPPFGMPPIGAVMPIPQIRPVNFPQIPPYGQPNGFYGPSQQGYPGQPPPAIPNYFGWPGAARQQQYNPFAAQSPSAYPVGMPPVQFGQPMANPYFGAPSVPYNPYPPPPPPPPPNAQYGGPMAPGYFQPAPPQPYDDGRMNSDRRNHEVNEAGQWSLGQHSVLVAHNPNWPYSIRGRGGQTFHAPAGVLNEGNSYPLSSHESHVKLTGHN